MEGQVKTIRLTALAAATLCVGISSSAFAADLPVKARPPAAAVVAAYSWTGCYIGAQGGYAKSRSPNSFSATGLEPFTPEADVDGSGAVAGGHIGCNYQIGNWVLGVEGDGEWTNLDGNDNGVGGDINEFQARWMASARGRVGYAFSNILLYATGGAAWMGVRSAVLNPPVETVSRTVNGWTVGGGLEVGFANRWSARVEYRFADFGQENFVHPINGYTERFNDLEVHAIRVGVSYRF
jgi:outer membrane immunogenic protein